MSTWIMPRSEQEAEADLVLLDEVALAAEDEADLAAAEDEAALDLEDVEEQEEVVVARVGAQVLLVQAQSSPSPEQKWPSIKCLLYVST